MIDKNLMTTENLLSMMIYKEMKTFPAETMMIYFVLFPSQS